MRLEPVFVVAPRSASLPTRRAFLLASSTFAAGASLGGACGYALGSAKATDAAAGGGTEVPVDPVAPAADVPLEPSGDVELDELRRLAVKAPIDELVQHRLAFVNATFMEYPKDKVLWSGVHRLCEYVLSGKPLDNRGQFARALAGVIEAGDPSVTLPLVRFIAELRRTG